MKQTIKKCLIIILSFIMVISFNINIDKNAKLLESFNANSSIVFMEFIVGIYVLNNVAKIKEKRLIICSCILAISFSLFSLVGNSINVYESLDGIIYSSNTVIKSIIKFIGNSILFYIVITILFDYINKINIQKIGKNKDENNKQKKWSNKKVFLISFAVIIICWLPYFLTYYPGLTTGDSMNQIFQSIGLENLSSHHPVIHTGVISLFIHIGNYFGSLNLGIALYTMFQMIIMALIFSYSIYYMNKKQLPKWTLVISALFYSIYPINPLFSLMMWKDIIFAGLMLLFVVNTYDIMQVDDKISIKKMIIYVINIILLILFRNNGLYVIILMIPFLLLLGRKKSKIIISVFIIALVLYFIINKLIFSCLNVEKGQIREALSIPMQQFARVVKYHKDELTTEEKEKIYKFIPAQNIDELYMPILSDPVKSQFDSKAFSENKVEFVKLWMELCIKYPRACIESFLCNSYGYYYPEAKHWVANRDVERNELGIYQDSKISGNIVRNIDSLIEKRNLPIISMMFSIGFIFWIICFSLMYCIYKKKYKRIIIYTPIILLWLTTLASPVFCEFRYVYSFITCLPFITLTIFDKNENY